MKIDRLVWTGGLLLVAATGPNCGDESATHPTPQPTPMTESWYVSPVLCENCPGLTNVEFDRTVTPHRARLPVGALTSLRASALVGCGTDEVTLHIVRWITGDPSVISVTPSSTESAIVQGLKPGTSSLRAERQLPSGTLSLGDLQDGFESPASHRCEVLPALVFEIVG